MLVERRAYSYLRPPTHAPLYLSSLTFDGFLPPWHRAHAAASLVSHVRSCSAASTIRCFPKEPTFGKRAMMVVVAWKHQREYDGGWSTPGPTFGQLVADQDPSPPGVHTTSTGAVQCVGCLHVHDASAFSLGIQRHIDNTLCAAVVSSLPRLRCVRQLSTFQGFSPCVGSGIFCFS